MLVEHLSQYINSADYAKAMDAADPLKEYRNKFYIPVQNGKEVIYFCGNSLGLQPKTTQKYIEQELQDWKELGVEGHMHGKNPWFYYHHFLEQPVANLVGALPVEVVVMNSLTVNLNIMMISFYRPTKARYKILMEASAFPSDQYAAESQVKFHNYDPHTAIIEVAPDEGETFIRTEKILQVIEENKNELALILIGGVNYYTGQLFNMKAITEKAKQCSEEIVVGYDLAHAAGNAELHLHDWHVDFAVWCSYKYLNSGPGGTSGVFVHEKHANNFSLPRLNGWWGNDEETRFKMQKDFYAQPGAAGWQMSNAQILPMAAHRAALEIFDSADMKELNKKTLLLTGYLEYLLLNASNSNLEFKIITPPDTAQRGCQLSILMLKNGMEIFNKLSANGIVADWREPGVIRVAPVPLYNTFEDVYNFARVFHSA